MRQEFLPFAFMTLLAQKKFPSQSIQESSLEKTTFEDH
jgi:hypothetical protein